MYGFSRGASSAETDGHVDRVASPRRSAGSRSSARRPAAPRSPAPRPSRRRDAACRRTFSSPNSGESVAGSVSNTSSAAPATWPDLIASASAASSTRPPRAQLMMRTPCLVCASASRDRMLRVASVSGVCSVMKSARASSVVELDLLDAEVERALLGQERVVGEHPHLQPDRAVGDDRADIAAADQAERLAGQLDAHEAVLFPLAGLGRGRWPRGSAGPARTSWRWRVRRW